MVLLLMLGGGVAMWLADGGGGEEEKGVLLVLGVRLGGLLRRAVGRVLVENVELLPSANSLDFILRGRRPILGPSASDNAIPVLWPEVVDPIVAVWDFTERKLANGNVLPGASFVFPNLDRVLGQQIAIRARQSHIFNTSIVVVGVFFAVIFIITVLVLI